MLPPSPMLCTVDFKLDGKPLPPSSASRYQPLLNDLLTSSIVLTEDFEKLSAQTQDEIRQCSETQKLLPLLVQHGLLTEYQAGRVEAGTTYGLDPGQLSSSRPPGCRWHGRCLQGRACGMRRPVAIKVLSMLCRSGFSHSTAISSRRFGSLPNCNIPISSLQWMPDNFLVPMLLPCAISSWSLFQGKTWKNTSTSNGPLSPVQSLRCHSSSGCGSC